MNIHINTKNKVKKMPIIKITETDEYQDMLSRVKFEIVAEYLKNNQGKTFEKIVSEFNEEKCKDGMKFLINIWINNWNTFLQSGGRIIKNNHKYYCLSPTNKRVRDRNPILEIL